MKLEDEKLKIGEYFETPKGREYLEELTKQYEIHNNRQKRFEKWLEVNDFDKLMYRLILEHNDEYIENCYHNGDEPYPNNKLWFVFCYAMKYGKHVKVKKIDTGLDNIWEFKDYYFQMIFGQGTMLRIYNKDDMRLLLQL